jgi:F-type H+-transporting ATPase subunit delta
MGSRLEEKKVALRYAKALLESADELGKVDEVASEVQAMASIFKETPSLAQFFANPGVERSRKQDFFEKELKGHLSPVMGNLLQLMIENDRVAAFPELADEFQMLMNRRNNVATAKVVTASIMDEELTRRVQEKLQSLFGFSRVEIENQVEPGILGGAIIHLQDRVIDGSYLGKLEAIRRQARIE